MAEAGKTAAGKSESGKKLEVRFGAFSCSVEGYDNPVEQMREVMLLMQRMIHETPGLADHGPGFGEDEVARIEHALDRRADREGGGPGIVVIRGPDTASGTAPGTAALSERNGEAEANAEDAVTTAEIAPQGPRLFATSDAEDPFAPPEPATPETASPEPPADADGLSGRNDAGAAPSDADMPADPFADTASDQPEASDAPAAIDAASRPDDSADDDALSDDAPSGVPADIFAAPVAGEGADAASSQTDADEPGSPESADAGSERPLDDETGQTPAAAAIFSAPAAAAAEAAFAADLAGTDDNAWTGTPPFPGAPAETPPPADNGHGRDADATETDPHDAPDTAPWTGHSDEDREAAVPPGFAEPAGATPTPPVPQARAGDLYPPPETTSTADDAQAGAQADERSDQHADEKAGDIDASDEPAPAADLGPETMPEPADDAFRDMAGNSAKDPTQTSAQLPADGAADDAPAEPTADPWTGGWGAPDAPGDQAGTPAEGDRSDESDLTRQRPEEETAADEANSARQWQHVAAQDQAAPTTPEPHAPDALRADLDADTHSGNGADVDADTHPGNGADAEDRREVQDVAQAALAAHGFAAGTGEGGKWRSDPGFGPAATAGARSDETSRAGWPDTSLEDALAEPPAADEFSHDGDPPHADERRIASRVNIFAAPDSGARPRATAPASTGGPGAGARALNIFAPPEPGPQSGGHAAFDAGSALNIFAAPHMPGGADQPARAARLFARPAQAQAVAPAVRATTRATGDAPQVDEPAAQPAADRDPPPWPAHQPGPDAAASATAEADAAVNVFAAPGPALPSGSGAAAARDSDGDSGNATEGNMADRPPQLDRLHSKWDDGLDAGESEGEGSWTDGLREPPRPTPAPTASGGERSRFSALLARLGGRGGESARTQAADPSDTDGAGGETTPADLARRADASSVSDLLAVAAAWLTLVEGKPRFTRREVMETFERLPGDHARTLEARIKGFGKLVRASTLILVDDGVFAMAQAERDRFQAILDGD